MSVTGFNRARRLQAERIRAKKEKPISVPCPAVVLHAPEEKPKKKTGKKK